MDLQTMRTEVQARGFSHVQTTFIDRWINLTYQDVNQRYPWPFLEATTSGVPPLTVADFSQAITVLDTTNKVPLVWKDIRFLQELDPSLALTGNARFWYRDGTAATNIRVYPTTASTVSLRYIKSVADLATDVSTPVSPSAFHYLYVEGACGRAYRRANELQAAGDVFQEVENGIQKMANYLLPPSLLRPDSGTFTGTQGEPTHPNFPGNGAPVVPSG